MPANDVLVIIKTKLITVTLHVLTLFSNRLDSATMITTRFPKATVSNQAAWHIAFMLIGAWREREGEKERESNNE